MRQWLAFALMNFRRDVDRHIYFRQALSLSPGVSRLIGGKISTLIRWIPLNCSQMHIIPLDLFTFCNLFFPCFESYPTPARYVTNIIWKFIAVCLRNPSNLKRVTKIVLQLTVPEHDSVRPVSRCQPTGLAEEACTRTIRLFPRSWPNLSVLSWGVRFKNWSDDTWDRIRHAANAFIPAAIASSLSS